MGKIFFLMGKSSSGKDTIYNRLINDDSLGLVPYVGYTTRPIRAGETDGVEYRFSNEDELLSFEKSGRLIEKRVYHTVYGDWYYFSVDTDKVDLSTFDYLYIGTLESYVKMREYYGEDKVVPIYVEVEDGLRLRRALARERVQKVPGYAEMCRRFLTDSEDFCEENLVKAGINKRFQNVSIDDCLAEIREEIFARK
ncbi:MAG: guanylate kinase [Lachnospiraceae bacterium]|jgi:guanylate kinase